MKTMKIACIFLLIASFAISSIAEETKRSAKIISLEGKAEVRLSADRKWIPAEKGMLLTEGDAIRTKAKSYVVLNLDGQGQTATMEVRENSEMTLAELKEDRLEKSQKTLLDVAIGKVMIEARKLDSDKSKFEVKTPTSCVGVRGTKFSVEVEALR